MITYIAVDDSTLQVIASDNDKDKLVQYMNNLVPSKIGTTFTIYIAFAIMSAKNQVTYQEL